jgi:hypothetical protein
LFWPTGVLAVIASIIANRRAATGDVDAAQQASQWARICCWASVGVFLVVSVLFAVGAVHTSTKI